MEDASLSGRMIRGAAYTFAALVVSELALALNSVALSRMLGSQDFGVLAIVWSVMALAGVFASSGVPAAVVKMVAEKGPSDPGAASEIVSAGLILTAVTAASTFAVVLLVSPLLSVSIYAEPILLWLLPMGAVALLVSSIPAPAFAVFQGFQRIRELNLRNISYSVASVLTMIVFVWWLGLPGAAVAGVIVAILNVAINAGLLRTIWSETHLSLRWPSNSRSYRRVAAFGGATVLGNMAIMMATFAGSTLLVTSRSFRELGYFTVALALASYLAFIPSSIGVPMVPAISEAHSVGTGGVSVFVTRTLRIVAVSVLPFAFLLQFLSAPVVEILYGPDYVPAEVLVVWLATAGYLISLSSVVGFAILGVGHVWHGVGLNVLWGFTYIVSAWLLVGSLGAFGLAVAFTAAYGCLLVAALLYIRTRLRVGLLDVWLPVTLGLVALGTGIIVQGFVSGLPRFVIGISGAIVLVVVGWMLLTDREKTTLLATLARFRHKIKVRGRYGSL